VTSTNDAFTAALRDYGVDASRSMLFSQTEAGTTLPGRVVADLRANPDTSSIFIFSDIFRQIVPEIEAAGLRDGITMAAYGGGTLALLRNGTVDVGAESAIDASMWATMDNLNRLFAGEQPDPKNTALAETVLLFDATNIGAVDDREFCQSGSLNWRDAYAAIWTK